VPLATDGLLNHVAVPSSFLYEKPMEGALLKLSGKKQMAERSGKHFLDYFVRPYAMLGAVDVTGIREHIRRLWHEGELGRSYLWHKLDTTYLRRHAAQNLAGTCTVLLLLPLKIQISQSI
jgi:hypothetical protein